MSSRPAPPSADLQTLASAGASIAAGLAANGLLTFALGVVVGRTLHPAGTGVFYNTVAIFTIAAVVAGLGTDIGTLRVLPKYLARRQIGAARAHLRVALLPVAAAAAAFALLVGAAGLAYPAGSAERASLLLVAPFVIPVALSVPISAATRAFGTTKPYVLIETVAKPGLRLVAVAVVAWAAPGRVSLAVFWWGAVALLTAAAGAIWLRRMLAGVKPEAGERAEPGVAREFWGFTLPRAIGSTLGVLLLWVDVVLLELLKGPAAAGVYSAAIRYLAVGTLALSAAGLVVGPQVSALFAAGEVDRVARVYKAATTWLCALALPVIIVTVAFAPLMMRLFGHGFGRGAIALAILSAAMAVNVAAGPVNIVLLMGGGSVANLVSVAAGLVTNVLLNLLLIPLYGVTGAALAWSIAIVMTNAVPLVAVRRRWHIHPGSTGLWAATASALACYGVGCAVGRLLLGDSPAALAVAVLAATAAYACALWRIRDRVDLTAFAAVPLELRGALTRRSVQRPSLGER